MGKSRNEKTTGDEDKGGKGGDKTRKPTTTTKNITDSLSEGSGSKGGKKPRTRKQK